MKFTNLLTRLCLPCFCVCLPVCLLGQEAVAETAYGGESLWGLIQQGGWAMWPLGLSCLAAIYLTLYCFRETSRKQFIPDALLPQLSEQLRQRDIDEASQLMGSQPSLLGRILTQGLTKARPELPDANKIKVELMTEESLEAEENEIAQWINYLNVIAAVAPMIGLLGTVSGMIGAFQTISFGGMGRPELLAGDIGEALITTAAGLVIGIPAMISYFIMKNRLATRILLTAQCATSLIDELAGDDVPSDIVH